jgi:hypothetical protein
MRRRLYPYRADQRPVQELGQVGGSGEREDDTLLPIGATNPDPDHAADGRDVDDAAVVKGEGSDHAGGWAAHFQSAAAASASSAASSTAWT